MGLKSVLVDGEWLLKRHFNRKDILFSNKGEQCNGVVGFLESLGSIANKIMPDRIVVVWDGDMSGKLKHDIYPLYKAGHKEWDEEYYFKTAEKIDDELKSKVSCSNQKRKIKNLIENLFIRQSEVEYIEGDDLIALYCLKKQEDEHVIIYSRDKDYYQLISETVSVLRPADGIILTPKNFKGLFGFTHLNCLMLKCFEGDDSDGVPGVPGLALKTILKYFPKFKDEEYTIERFIEEAIEIYSSGKKKLKTIETVMGSRKIVERNKKLMDLKNPIVNQEAIEEIEMIKDCVLAKEGGYVDRSMKDAMHDVIAEGYVRHMYNQDINKFFLPFHRIAAKEKEYTQKVLNS